MSTTPSTPEQKDISKRVIHIILQLGVLAFILGWCIKILSPFLLPVIWALIIAITVYPLFVKLKAKLGNSGKLASTLITITFLAILIVPTIILSGSLIDGAKSFKAMIDEGHSLIPPPGERAKSLPSFAQPLVNIWQEASENLQGAVTKYNEQFKAAGLFILSLIANTGVGILYLLISIIIAGIFLAYAKEGGATLRTIFVRIAGKKGEELAAVSEATIRSVVKGILGVAVIQATMAGLGFFIAGVPYAGVWIVGCLFLAIIQVGSGPIAISIAIYMFSVADTLTVVLLAIWLAITLFSDNILKPLLLGRGAPAPMLVVFLGSIGGFITSGFLGLFLGAVILTIGYKLFKVWLESNHDEDSVTPMP